MRRRLFFAGGLSTGPALLALLVWSNACSHQRAGLESETRTQVPDLFVPYPAFAQTRGRTNVSIADIAEQSLPAVVNISSTKVIRQDGEEMRAPFFNDPFFRRYFGDEFFPFHDVPRERRERSLGSGVIVGSDGTVLTNNHVVERAERIRVTLADKRELDAKIIGTDPKSDLAVLKLAGAPRNLRPLPFGDSNRLRLGDVVIAIGNPFGVGQTVTMGIVSAKGRANMGIVDYEDFIQTDAAINPGNSGGALINMAGELVGINTAILSRTGGYQGIGFAIPSNMVRPIVESLTRHGKVIRGWLGVAIQDLTEELSRAMGLKSTRGVLVGDVASGSPADRAGMRRGDVVVKINGEEVDSASRLRNVVAAAGKGAKVKLETMRGHRRRTFELELGELPTAIGGQARIDKGDGSLGGLTVASLSPMLRDKYRIPERLAQGVVVQAVASESPASRAGLREGDVILELNRETVTSAEQFAKLSETARGRILLLVYRDGHTVYLLLGR
ncbi:MAG: DegQ family serine endoprotease [Deltaproteobacteria bacterium]|nr:DegQ family serine endoprotease [Deltaproteobacteria bacterium]